MLPFGEHTVTMYHHTNGTITRIVLHGCSWRTVYGRSLYDNVMKPSASVCSCRYTDGPVAATGDVFIKGEAQERVKSSVELPELLEKYRDSGAFVCETFSNNAQGTFPLKHYCARGQAYGV